MSKPKSILITGASSGIGEALALYYAAHGITLFLSGRNSQRLEAVVRACRAKGAVAEGRIIDVADRHAMREWVLGLDSRQALDLVIANAGISGGTGGGGEDEEQVRAIFEINVTGVLNTILPLLPRMQGRGRGHIAIIASMAGFFGWPGAPAYSASKAAVRVYGEALCGQLAGSGVDVSVICPGFVESRMTAVNNYPMPFLMTVDKAAAIIASGLARKKARIAFPLQARLIIWILSLLPHGALCLILKNTPQKPSRQ